MKTYEFTIEISGARNLMTDNVPERLYEAGCDDATICQLGGVLRARFSREAESLNEAIASAQAQILSVVKPKSMTILVDYDQ